MNKYKINVRLYKKLKIVLYITIYNNYECLGNCVYLTNPNYEVPFDEVDYLLRNEHKCIVVWHCTGRK